MSPTPRSKRPRAMRRPTLGLLAGLAVTLSAVAAPLAGAAHAGGSPGGVLGDRGTPRGGLSLAPGEAGGSGAIDRTDSTRGGAADGIQRLGSKRGIASGTN
jgi:hypothetical protein